MKKLYLAYMWWTSTDRLMEDHEILLIVADNASEAKIIAKEKTKLKIAAHVDMMIEVNNVDWHNISLEQGWTESIKKVSDYDTLN